MANTMTNNAKSFVRNAYHWRQNCCFPRRQLCAKKGSRKFYRARIYPEIDFLSTWNWGIKLSNIEPGASIHGKNREYSVVGYDLTDDAACDWCRANFGCMQETRYKWCPSSRVGGLGGLEERSGLSVDPPRAVWVSFRKASCSFQNLQALLLFSSFFFFYESCSSLTITQRLPMIQQVVTVIQRKPLRGGHRWTLIQGRCILWAAFGIIRMLSTSIGQDTTAHPTQGEAPWRILHYTPPAVLLYHATLLPLLPTPTLSVLQHLTIPNSLIAFCHRPTPRHPGDVTLYLPYPI